MGKAGRLACILTPWALTVASFICLLLVELGGWRTHSPELNSLYFFQADFTGLDVSAASTLANTTTLTLALAKAQSRGRLVKLYQIHLRNYCSANGSNASTSTIDYCAPRHATFYFDPVEVWGLNATNQTASSTNNDDDNANANNPISSEVDNVKNSTESLETEVLGRSGREAMDAYRRVVNWMDIAYRISFWSTLATLCCGKIAIFSRWGSALTWVFSIVRFLVSS